MVHGLNQGFPIVDDTLRSAGSLKPGAVQASELMGSFLASAIAELGRISKAIYLLDYIDDAAFRRRILVQINRGEHRHRMIRAICHGRRGETGKPYRQGRKTNRAPSAWSPMRSCSGTRSTWRPP